MEEFKNEVSSELKKMGSFNDWLFLKKMITPMVIQIIYWLGILVVIIFGLFTIIKSFWCFWWGSFWTPFRHTDAYSGSYYGESLL
jgi:hypothetical protein